MIRTEELVYTEITDELSRRPAGREVERAQHLAELWAEMAEVAPEVPSWARVAARTLSGRYSAEAVELQLAEAGTRV